MSLISFRNIVRYVHSVADSLPLYQALGFEVRQKMGKDMAILQNAEGVKLILHFGNGRQGDLFDTGLGFSATGDLAEARAVLEKAGFKLLRAPEEGDQAVFYVYGDLDGNPINLVAARPH